MGLDSVELILAIEDAFRIRIAREEAANVLTVGDLHHVVLSKLEGHDSARCLTSAAFYRTRCGMIEALDVGRRDILPSTSLEVILPRNRRREQWQSLQAAMKVKLPELRHPRWIALSLLAFGVALAMVLGIYLDVGIGMMALLPFLGFVVGVYLIALSPAWAVAFPREDATVGDLARDVLAVNHATLVDEIGSWNNKEVWESLCRVIVMQTGVPREKITPSALIVAGLGID